MTPDQAAAALVAFLYRVWPGDALTVWRDTTTGDWHVLQDGDWHVLQDGDTFRLVAEDEFKPSQAIVDRPDYSDPRIDT